MAQNQTRDGTYGLQPIANAQRTVVQQGGETWAESMHTHWQAGYLSPKNKHENPLKLRALFRAIRMLEVGDDRQKKKARDLSRFLASVWGLAKAWVAAAEGDIDAGSELREQWGDAQLPPVDGGFVNGIAADEAIIDAIVRRLG